MLATTLRGARNNPVWCSQPQGSFENNPVWCSQQPCVVLTTLRGARNNPAWCSWPQGSLENNPAWWDPAVSNGPKPADAGPQPFLQLEAFGCSFVLQMMPTADLHVGFKCSKLKVYDVRSARKVRARALADALGCMQRVVREGACACARVHVRAACVRCTHSSCGAVCVCVCVHVSCDCLCR